MQMLQQRMNEKFPKARFSKIKAIILDRDGTINKTKPADKNNPADTGYVLNPSQWVFAENAQEGLQHFSSLGLELHIFTQQSGVGKDTLPDFDENALDAVHGHMRQQLRNLGVRIGVIRYCPHVKNEDGTYACACAKLKRSDASEDYLGMLGSMLLELGLSPNEVLVIGDTERDLPPLALELQGMCFMGVENPLKRKDAEKMHAQGYCVLNSLKECAELLEIIKKQ